MVRNHLKSIAAPKTWPIKRKEEVYISKPYASGQKNEFVLPVSIIFKDVLKYCKTSKEVRMVLKEKGIMIDGKKVNDEHEALGLFSTLTITETSEHFRMTINKKGKLELKKIDKKEADLKPCKIQNKRVLGKDKIQINMSDGRNILVKKDEYKTGDALIISVPKQAVKEHVKLEKGTVIVLTGGKHIGSTGHVEHIEGDKIKFQDGDKKVHETEKRYAFPIGTKKAALTV